MWVQDRLDEGRRVARHTLHDGRKVAERTLADGGKLAGRTWLDSRRVAERAYDEGRDVAGRAYRDGRRDAQRRLEEGRHLVADRLDEGRHLLADRLHDGRHLLEDRLHQGRRSLTDSRRTIKDRFGEHAPAVEAGVVTGAVIWSALLVAAGASVAYFCWNQYRRGRSERHDRYLDEPGGAGPSIHKPEMVMAHNAAPAPQGHEAVDPSDAELSEPAEALLLHAPLDDTPPEGASANAQKAALRDRSGDEPAADAKALAAAASAARAAQPAALEESLAVQGAASASKRKSPNGATAGAAKPRRKGPTVM